MNALVVDRDPSARILVRRILVRDFGCDITEVDNGLDALDALSEKQFGFMLLDPEVPVVNGFRVLEAVRRTPAQQSLPVMIVTRQRDESAVRRLAELGISDYLIKPLEATLTGARLNRLIAETGRSNGGAETADTQPRTPSLQLGATVMIADGSADFRHLFTEVLNDKATVVTAASGVQALRQCKQKAPDAVFIGDELGMLDQDLLVTELRSLPPLSGAQIIRVADQEVLEDVRQDGRWTGAVLRTFVPETFLEEVDRVFGSLRPITQMLKLHPRLKLNLLSAMEQVCGLMLKTKLVVRPVTREDRQGPQRIAAVAITLDDQDLTLTLEVRCGLEAARKVVSMVMDTDPTGVGKDDIESNLAELANLIAKRLQHGLGERGINVSCGLPLARSEEAGPAPRHDDEAIEILMASTDTGLAIEVGLS